MSITVPLSAPDVRTMLTSGVHQQEVIRQLVSTGNWSEAGAAEIVRFMTHGPDALFNVKVPLPRRRPEPRGRFSPARGH